MNNNILIFLALALAWFVLFFTVPRNLRGIANAIYGMFFACSMIALALNNFS